MSDSCIVTPIGLALIVLGWSGCAAPEPTPELMMSHHWVVNADRQVLKYGCAEAQRVALEADDPLESIRIYVNEAGQLKRMAAEPIDPWFSTPPSVAGGLDSLRAAVAHLASGFTSAPWIANTHVRECDEAASCNESARALAVVVWGIDIDDVQAGFEAYFRHRVPLAEIFEREGAPLPAAATCREHRFPPREGRPTE
jgi:hypothetical protein